MPAEDDDDVGVLDATGRPISRRSSRQREVVGVDEGDDVTDSSFDPEPLRLVVPGVGGDDDALVDRELVENRRDCPRGRPVGDSR